MEINQTYTNVRTRTGKSKKDRRETYTLMGQSSAGGGTGNATFVAPVGAPGVCSSLNNNNTHVSSTSSLKHKIRPAFNDIHNRPSLQTGTQRKSCAPAPWSVQKQLNINSLEQLSRTTTIVHQSAISSHVSGYLEPYGKLFSLESFEEALKYVDANKRSVITYHERRRRQDINVPIDVLEDSVACSVVYPNCSRLQQLHTLHQKCIGDGKVLRQKAKNLKTDFAEIMQNSKNEIERIRSAMPDDDKEQTLVNIKDLQVKYESLAEKTNISKTYMLLYGSLPTIYYNTSKHYKCTDKSICLAGGASTCLPDS